MLRLMADTAVTVLMCASCPLTGARLDAWWIIVLEMLGMPVISFSFSFLDFHPPRPDHWPVLIFYFYTRLRRWPVPGPGNVTLLLITFIISTIIIFFIMFVSVRPHMACLQRGQTSLRGQFTWYIKLFYNLKSKGLLKNDVIWFLLFVDNFRVWDGGLCYREFLREDPIRVPPPGGATRLS